MSPMKVRQRRNARRRLLAEVKQAPMSLAWQQQRTAENKARHKARYPHPPILDPLSQVAGNPADRGVIPPAHQRPPARQLTFADIIYVFGVEGLARKRRAA